MSGTYGLPLGEYLERIADLTARYEAEIAPHAHLMRESLYAAEQRAADRINAGPPETSLVPYSQRHTKGADVTTALRSYQHKWHEQDCRAALAREVEDLERAYAAVEQQLLDAHHARIRERLCHLMV